MKNKTINDLLLEFMATSRAMQNMQTELLLELLYKDHEDKENVITDRLTKLRGVFLSDNEALLMNFRSEMGAD